MDGDTRLIPRTDGRFAADVKRGRSRRDGVLDDVAIPPHGSGQSG